MSMKQALTALLLAVLLAACSGKESAPLPPGTVVLALGDSITAGYGLSPEQAWPALLASQTGWTIVNGGVSGNTAGDALARLPALLDKHAPKLVLVILGGNDMLRKVPETQTRQDLARVLKQARDREARAVLIATPKPSVAGAVFQRLSAPPFYTEIAREMGVPLLADAVPDVLSDPELKLDPLHPNAEGHRALAGKLFDGLRKLGYVR